MFTKNGKTYCDCGASIDASTTRCDLCTLSYAADDEYQRKHNRYGGILVKGKISIPIRLNDQESWNTPDNAR